jgi:pullulanase/glycogen debranching enzyme
MTGDTLLLLLNASEHELPFALPGGSWREVVNTANPVGDQLRPVSGDAVRVPATTLILLQRPEPR